MPSDEEFQKIFSIIVEADIQTTLSKNRSYDESWKRRGGTGAFFTIARPIDRFESISAKDGYDVLKILEEEKAAGKNGEDGTLLATIRDIRCYMMLLEAELMFRDQVNKYATHVHHTSGPTP